MEKWFGSIKHAIHSVRPQRGRRVVANAMCNKHGTPKESNRQAVLTRKHEIGNANGLKN